jgi:hypothetical protein
MIKPGERTRLRTRALNGQTRTRARVRLPLLWDPRRLARLGAGRADTVFNAGAADRPQEWTVLEAQTG